VIACALLHLLSFATADAQTAPSAADAPRPTREEAEQWMRDNVAAYVNPRGATAAAAAVVADGRILALGTYGWFDPVRKIAVSPHDQFLVGSITKSFVSLVVARLIQQGLIGSIDDPVNRYLKRYPLPPPYGPKVTLGELATHTAGLDSPGFGTASNDQHQVPASADYLRRKLPAIVRPPGFKAVYANFGPAILGAAIEDATGERLDRVVDRVLLRPLGMRDTIFGYDVSGGPRLVYAGIQRNGAVDYAVRTINVPMLAPAGSIQATAEDMGRYMNALLGHAPEVLNPQMIALERTARAVNHPGLSPIGLGIFLDRWNTTPVLGHGGLIAGFRSTFAIVPSNDFGVFVVFAGGVDPYTGGPGNPGAAVDALLATVLGPVQPLPAHATTADPSVYAGHYWLELRAHTSPEVLFGLDRRITVAALANGELLIGDGESASKHYVEVAPGLYQGPAEHGRQPSLYGFEPGLMLMNKMYAVRVAGWHDPRNWQRCGIVFLAAAALGLLAILWRGPGRIAATLAGLAAALAAYTFAWPVLRDIDVDTSLFLGSTWRFTVGHLVAWAFLFCGISGAATVIRRLRRSDVSTSRERWTLAHRGLVALACLGLVCIAQAANLLW
jgi:CubicO group peptidase (beta-lactamase class C family)